MIGQQLGHYRIEARLGAGGMGVVWRAHDMRLGRAVALKVLPDALVADPVARARLVREARTASALNHPNILTVHEVGEDRSHVFLVAEYIPGEPLSARIAAGPLPVETALHFGAQVADALAHAHEHGVIHGDVKPSNVLITPDGRAKVLDFGLARLVGPANDAALTRTSDGRLAGTPSAMAPELWRGAAPDARSDVWALGVLLHSMIAGHEPFHGETVHALSAAVLTQPPAPLPPSTPSGVAAVIARCLAKEPSARWRSAAEVRAALEALAAGASGTSILAASAPPRRRWGPALVAAAGALVAVVVILAVTGRIPWRFGRPAGSGITSLAVLPLDNFSHDPAQDDFAVGITEELTTRLAQLGALRVISRTSAMRFRGSKESLPEIARQLGADAVIEGSVERAGDRVRITAQLVRARTDEHLWARSYERDMKDALALQDEVAGAIVAEIQGKLAPRAAAPARAVAAAVVQSYLRGRGQYERWDDASERRALAFFDQALALDSTYAPAYAGRALALQWFGSSPDTIALARAAAERALALDPSLSEAHATLAQIELELDWNWAAAEREFRRALELNPNNVDAHHQYSHLLMALNRPEAAIAEGRIGLALDPLSPAILGHMAWIGTMTGRCDSTVYWARQALAVDPTYSSAVEHLCDCDLAERRWADWKVDLDRRRRMGSDIDSLDFPLADALQAGRKEEATRLVRMMESPVDSHPHWFSELASLELALGNRDAALAQLQAGFAGHSYDMIYADRDPMLAALRGDPQIAALRQRAGLPTATFAPARH